MTFENVGRSRREWFAAEFDHERPDWSSIQSYKDTAAEYKAKMDKYIEDGKVECAGLYLDKKGTLLIFKTSSPKIKAEAQKYVDNMQKLLGVGGPHMSESCCVLMSIIANVCCNG